MMLLLIVQKIARKLPFFSQKLIKKMTFFQECPNDNCFKGLKTSKISFLNNYDLEIFEKWHFLEKNGNFLAIFGQLNVNFPEGKLHSHFLPTRDVNIWP